MKCINMYKFKLSKLLKGERSDVLDQLKDSYMKGVKIANVIKGKRNSTERIQKFLNKIYLSQSVSSLGTVLTRI